MHPLTAAQAQMRVELCWDCRRKLTLSRACHVTMIVMRESHDACHLLSRALVTWVSHAANVIM